MMKLKYTLSVAALTLAATANAQNWIPDTISMGVGYANDVYYSFEDGVAGTPDNTNWHLAFEALNAMGDTHGGVGIWTNEACKAGQNVKLYAMHTSASATFLTATDADTVGKMTGALHNDTTTYANGAFNATASADQFDYGWGFYSMTEVGGFPAHSVVGDSLFLLTLNTPGTMGQPGIQNAAYFVWPRAFSENKYTMYIREVGSSDIDTIILDIEDADQVFTYYNLSSGEVINREPSKAAWDFNLTNYMDLYEGNIAYGLQGVTGILSNYNILVAQADSIVPNDADYNSFTEDDYIENINVVGADWKTVNMQTFGYDIVDSQSWFFLRPNGDIWQVYFDYFAKNETTQERLAGLQKRKVYTKPVAVDNINNAINTLVIAPNPSEGGTTNILLDAKKDLDHTQIMITDISGRVVMTAVKNINAGFQQLRLDVSNLAPGMYVVNLSGEGWSNSQKLIVR